MAPGGALASRASAASEPSVATEGAIASLPNGQRQERAAGRADLDLGAHRRADAAVVAGRPAAVFDFLRLERVLPVVPEPVLVQPGVQVVPGEHLRLEPLAHGVPVERHGRVAEDRLAGRDPAVEGEVLAPAVEAAAVLPHLADHRADPAVAAGEESFDDRRAAVVVADADGLAV